MEGISDRLSGDKGQQSLRNEIQEASQHGFCALPACRSIMWEKGSYRTETEGLERPRQLKCVRRARGNMSPKGALENCRAPKGQLSDQNVWEKKLLKAG